MTMPARALAPSLLLLVALTACGGGGGSGEQEEFVDDGVEGQPDDAIAADDCLIGDWILDVADYGARSSDYVTGLGIPITEFAMDGGGLLFFAADGSMQMNVDLTTSGVLVAGDARVPISVPSSYHATGTWSRPEAEVDAINIEDVTEEGTPTSDEVPVPMFDFAANPRVFITCEPDLLILQGADAPISSFWTRTG
jgi:hypothetical protein